MKKTYTIRKERFLDWYFESGQDSENENIKRSLGTKVIEELIKNNTVTITTRDIFNEANHEAVKLYYLEEFGEDDEGELGSVEGDWELELITGEEEIELWSEGFSATGESGPATFHGKFKANSLKEAVELFKDTLPDSSKKLISMTTLSFWGCRFFDNEGDARRTFG